MIGQAQNRVWRNEATRQAPLLRKTTFRNVAKRSQTALLDPSRLDSGDPGLLRIMLRRRRVSETNIRMDSRDTPAPILIPSALF